MISKKPEPTLPHDVLRILKEENLILIKYLENGTRSDILKVRYRKEASPLFLKIAKNEKGSLLLSNQYVWTKQITQLIPPDANFDIIRPVNTGVIDSKTWILSEFVSGTPLAKLNNEFVAIFQVDQPQKYLEPIADMILFIEKSEAIGLRGIDYQIGKEHKTNKNTLLEEAVRMSSPAVPFLSELLKIISANYKDLGKTSNHGDITPINIIILKNNKVILTDADLANILTFKYYDLAEFYNRLYTSALRPDLATQFLKIIMEKLNKQEVDKFLHNFLCLSSLRAIANFHELTNIPIEKQTKRIDAATKYASLVVSKKIIDI